MSKTKSQDTSTGQPAITPADRLDALGIDAICERLQSCETMTSIAVSLGMRISRLQDWIAADAGRSVRVREARAATAAQYDDEALSRIDAAKDPFELARAREAAQHLRWRASKIAPREYGDKVQAEVTGRDGGPIEQTVNYAISGPIADMIGRLAGPEIKVIEEDKT